MAGGCLVEPLTSPRNKSSVAMEERREGAVVVGDQLAYLQGSALLLQEADVDRRNAWRFQGARVRPRKHAATRRFGKLSRLTLAVTLLYVWLVENGAEVIKR